MTIGFFSHGINQGGGGGVAPTAIIASWNAYLYEDASAGDVAAILTADQSVSSWSITNGSPWFTVVSTGPKTSEIRRSGSGTSFVTTTGCTVRATNGGGSYDKWIAIFVSSKAARYRAPPAAVNTLTWIGAGDPTAGPVVDGVSGCWRLNSSGAFSALNNTTYATILAASTACKSVGPAWTLKFAESSVRQYFVTTGNIPLVSGTVQGQDFAVIGSTPLGIRQQTTLVWAPEQDGSYLNLSVPFVLPGDAEDQPQHLLKDIRMCPFPAMEAAMQGWAHVRVDAATNIVTWGSRYHRIPGFQTGAAILMYASGYPSPTDGTTVYYWHNLGDNTNGEHTGYVCATLADAQAGTSINLTTAGASVRMIEFINVAVTDVGQNIISLTNTSGLFTDWPKYTPVQFFQIGGTGPGNITLGENAYYSGIWYYTIPTGVPGKFRIASTIANARDGVFVDITSAGSGGVLLARQAEQVNSGQGGIVRIQRCGTLVMDHCAGGRVRYNGIEHDDGWGDITRRVSYIKIVNNCELFYCGNDGNSHNIYNHTCPIFTELLDSDSSTGHAIKLDCQRSDNVHSTFGGALCGPVGGDSYLADTNRSDSTFEHCRFIPTAVGQTAVTAAYARPDRVGWTNLRMPPYHPRADESEYNGSTALPSSPSPKFVSSGLRDQASHYNGFWAADFGGYTSGDFVVYFIGFPFVAGLQNIGHVGETNYWTVAVWQSNDNAWHEYPGTSSASSYGFVTFSLSGFSGTVPYNSPVMVKPAAGTWDKVYANENFHRYSLFWQIVAPNGVLDMTKQMTPTYGFSAQLFDDCWFTAATWHSPSNFYVMIQAGRDLVVQWWTAATFVGMPLPPLADPVGVFTADSGAGTLDLSPGHSNPATGTNGAGYGGAGGSCVVQLPMMERDCDIYDGDLPVGTPASHLLSAAGVSFGNAAPWDQSIKDSNVQYQNADGTMSKVPDNTDPTYTRVPFRVNGAVAAGSDTIVVDDASSISNGNLVKFDMVGPRLHEYHSTTVTKSGNTLTLAERVPYPVPDKARGSARVKAGTRPSWWARAKDYYPPAVPFG